MNLFFKNVSNFVSEVVKIAIEYKYMDIITINYCDTFSDMNKMDKITHNDFVIFIK